MIGRTNAGKAGIRFKVVGGTTQPDGRENLVWVKTDTNITSWVVSPNQPSEPADGMVWIQNTGDDGINLLKKNTIKVCPTLCRQYINGLWVNVEAHLFKNGEWVQFSYTILTLFDNGNECIIDTGGWIKSATSTVSGGVYFDTSVAGTYSKGTELKMSGSRSNDSTILNSYRPVNKIDVTNYATMRIYGTFSASGPSGWGHMSIYKGNPPFHYDNNITAVTRVNKDNVAAVNAKGYVDVDITSVTGLVTIILGIFCYGYKGASSASYTISKVELI